MANEIDRIVEEVVSRLQSQFSIGPARSSPPRLPGEGARPALILTDDLGRVNAAFDGASRRQCQAVSVFVGGSARQRSNIAGFRSLFFADDSVHRQIDLVSSHETFVLFGLALPTVARLAQLVMTEPLEVLVFNALSLQKSVLAAPLAGDPLFDALPAELRAEFSRFMQRLESFGVKQERMDAVFELAGAATPGSRPNAGPATSGTHSAGAVTAHRSSPNIVTVRDVQDRQSGSRLKISGPYRLTDLAREYVKKNSIVIEP